jgi:hypothetical protein
MARAERIKSSELNQRISYLLPTMQVIPFDDIVSGASARVTVIEDKQYLSVRDLIMFMCDKDNNQAGRVWRDMNVEHKEEVQPFLLNFKFLGQGQSVQPVITFPGTCYCPEHLTRFRRFILNIRRGSGDYPEHPTRFRRLS